MTSIIFTGKHWIGAGLVYHQSGSYTVSDELAKYLTETHPDLFALGEATQEQSEAPAPTKSLSKMNKDELQAFAAEIKAEVNAEMTADEMRATIKAAQAN